MSEFFSKFHQIFTDLNFDIKNFFFKKNFFIDLTNFLSLKDDYNAICRFIKQIWFELDYVPLLLG